MVPFIISSAALFNVSIFFSDKEAMFFKLLNKAFASSVNGLIIGGGTGGNLNIHGTVTVKDNITVNNTHKPII